jgi:aspartate kinase
MGTRRILVRKFGGAGLATIDKVKEVALSLKKVHDGGHSVIAVVSAMGTTTDQLIQKAYEISSHPDRRELDMLISTGERVSMSLLTMALKDLGCDAISFTGSQAGVLTDGSHSSARILEVKPQRVEEAVHQGKIVVIAGFQGVDPVSKEITTLGRGGTDTTAVAFAAHFKAERCEIIKEVDGIFTADPKLFPQAQLIREINYETLLHMCQWGAKALHSRSVEMARTLNTPIWVGSLNHFDKGTLCHSRGVAQGMNVLNHVFSVSVASHSPAWTQFKETFQKRNWQEPVLLAEETVADQTVLWLQALPPVFDVAQEVLKSLSGVILSHYPLTAVTFSGHAVGTKRMLPSLHQIKSEHGTTFLFGKVPSTADLAPLVPKN